MGLVSAFHTDDEKGDKLVHHTQSGCGSGKEIIKNGHYEAGILPGSKPCKHCAAIAAAAMSK